MSFPPRLYLGILGIFILAGCTTTKPPVKTETPPLIIADMEEAPLAAPDPIPVPQPELEPEEAEPLPPILMPTPEPVAEEEPIAPPAYVSGFKDLKFWQGADPRPALTAFQRTCKSWRQQPQDKWLVKSRPIFGQIKDWTPACLIALDISAPSRGDAVHFFQTNFEPHVVEETPQTGLLTGYYAPEIEVRLKADKEFSEPILARPPLLDTQNLPREKINAQSAKVLAYGKPIDVFFLQIQGSGRIKFKDGTTYMAAFDGHNGHKFIPIGRLLIERKELKKDKVSKQAIEKWMQDAGVDKASQLMNENPRYVFFKTEELPKSGQPKGAAGVPLTPLGSIAVDDMQTPYGTLVWLETKLPVKGGDFKGKLSGILVVAQDTGGAIKGKYRGDLYFGAGLAAGAKAGVMKHKAAWTLFLPLPLAIQAQAQLAVPSPLS